MNLYAEVTERIVRELEQGTAPWVRPWFIHLPHNAATQHRYNGVNILLLWQQANQEGFKNPGWLTFKQAKDLGGSIKKGAKGTGIVYTSTHQKSSDTQQTSQTEPTQHSEADESAGNKDTSYRFLKRFVVFNLEQTEGLADHFYHLPEPTKPEDRLERVDTFITNLGATLKHGGNLAAYLKGQDIIVLPHLSSFKSIGDYYSTSLHEHAHWSGHSSRLNRDLNTRFGSQSYAAEELIAEITGAFLCALLGIQGNLQHATYIGSWLKLLKSDSKALFHAAARATEAAEYLKNLQPPPTSENRPSKTSFKPLAKRT
jgi:antirestriction protein ArdC